MKFTLSWLKDHLETTAQLSEILDRLTSLGLEVEGVDDPAEKLKSIVIADVVTREKHPNADRLSLCQVDAGTGELIQVVCGAPNVRQRMKVAFAPIGAVIPSTGQALKKGKIRDIESCGMLCSARELEVGEGDEGILDLETSAKAGTPFAQVMGYNDPIIEIALTPNRADCFGVRGIARDLAASGLGTLKPLPYKEHTGVAPCPIQVHIHDSKACPGFSGVFIQNLKNEQSPDWVQNRLKAVGLRPINALVDVTNYLTYDLCRPLHVFDADKISGSLHVRFSKTGEKLEALNDKTYDLDDQTIVITDESKVLALGGIMGGIASGCTESTTSVFVECALFDPIRIALTGRKLNILSDARTRLERGVDSESLFYGQWAAITLIQEWCGGTASQIVMATHNAPTPLVSAKPITLTLEKLQGLTGCLISLQEAKVFLEKLGFSIVKNSEQSIDVLPPSHRHDIFESVDLIEEILRLKGYDVIPTTPLPSLPVQVPPASVTQLARRCAAARGLCEAITWSFMDPAIAKLFGWEDLNLQLSNPISQDLSVMRPTILANLISASVRNKSRGIDNACLFEVGPQFEKSSQKKVLCGLRSGFQTPRHWSSSPRNVDVYDAKADALAILEAVGISESSLVIESSAPSYYHPGRSGALKQGNRVLAYFGQVHPKISQDLDSEQTLVGFEIFLDLINPPKIKKSALTLHPYQPVVRDFAFVLDRTVTADTLVKAVAKIDRSLITAVDVFDVYMGDKLPNEKKSLAIQVRFDPQKGTMTEADISDVSTKIITTVEKTTGGVLRQA